MSKKTAPVGSKRIMRFLNWSAGVGLFLCLLSLSGCQQKISDPESLLPVHGTVFLNGKPLSGATVTFQAIGGEKLSQEAAAGTTDENGVYHLQTLFGKETRNGAGRGRYRVVISRLVSSDGAVYLPNPDEPPVLSGFRESLPSRYSDSMTTELTAVLSEANIELNFSLSDSSSLDDNSR